MFRVREIYAAMDSRNSGKTLRRTVLGPALVQGAFSGLHYVLRGREVGLANLQVDDAFALLFERPGFDQDLEGRLHPYAGHRFDKLHVLRYGVLTSRQ